MNKDTLLQLFKAPYKRQAFIENGLLPTFQGKVTNLKIYDAQGLQPIELTASEQNYAISAVKYGEFQTLDEIPRTVELYEIIVNDNKQIERSRVGLGALVKKHIIGNNAVLVNFAYQNPEKRTWRFSFIARDGVFQDGEMQIKDTHPKRYTYVFGEPEETYKTALDRFFILGNELEITINKIKDAFGVEAMSKAFFDEYRDVHYAGFVDYLMRSNFKKSAFNGNDKDVRDFVKKLLGRIVFLYFLQKKGWLGAKDTSYKNGDKNFMTNFFKKAGVNDAFYANWLSKLFFDALNNERPNDDFTMPDGEVVKIPYLNGGLFEKETEKYDYLTFPTDLFTNLFEFFNQYNFTIFEDSPEEHTVAVDPEMLGHIFENLLEDNKDKGAFYTPKEIVHYMTQESLIEYLHTQLSDADRTDLENFVKNKDNKLSKEHKAAIDQKLDTVKICDPAIGSGAFPMGLLQEIFGLKERIAYDLGHKVWSPATVKENIIQKSIYGVDIERGAVDIARLRFWLSLIVDEEMPKALPNLDYKIVVGNSLVSKFDDTVIEIDWSDDTAKEGLFGQEIAEDKKKLLKEISAKQTQYFTADNALKEKLNFEIRNLKLAILTKQLELMIENKGFESDSMQGLNKKQIEAWQQTQDWKAALKKLKHLKENPALPFNHFDWKLDFPEVLNPLVNENTGFDIVIGNPPYVDYRLIDSVITHHNNFPINKSSSRPNLYQFFIELGDSLLSDKGIFCFINPNQFLSTDNGLKLREHIIKNRNIKFIVDVSYLKVFKEASTYTVVWLFQNNISQKNEIRINRCSEIDKIAQTSFKIRQSDLKLSESQIIPINFEYFALAKIEKDKEVLGNIAKLKWGTSATGYGKKKINVDAYNTLSATKQKLYKPILQTSDTKKYYIDWQGEYIPINIYSDSIIKEFNKTKIVIGRVTKQIQACLDEKFYFIGKSTLITDSKLNLKLLLSILNSAFANRWYYLKFETTHMAGGYLRFDIPYLEKLPIPIVSNKTEAKLIGLTDKIISMKTKSIKSDTSSLEQQIDNLVYKLYGLTYEEVKVIDPEFALSKKEYQAIKLEDE